jgi:hypothetical protein
MAWLPLWGLGMRPRRMEESVIESWNDETGNGTHRSGSDPGGLSPTTLIVALDGVGLFSAIDTFVVDSVALTVTSISMGLFIGREAV